jgi:hypothetical protein
MPINVPQINPRLATISAPNLPQIDVLGAVNAGFGISDKLKQNRQDEALQTLIQEQGQAALSGNQQALDQIALQGKDGAELAGQLQNIVSSRNADAFTTAQNQLRKNGTFFASIINAPPEVQRRALFDRANELLSEGDRENGGELLQMSQSKDPLDMQGSIEQKQILSQGGDKYLQGFTNQGKGSGGLASAKTEIFRNGAAIQALPSGEIQVRDPAGIIVTGEERLQVLRDAQQSGILQAGEKATAIKKAERGVEAETAGDVVAAEKSALRGQEAIDVAFETGEGIPVINRALDLLGSVKTGGFEQAKIRAAQTFGIEGADEGELSNLLGKNVLKQLRTTFGAAFTEKEGNKLDAIEAGFGKNAATNKRLLENALATATRSVKRGIRAAKRAGQDEEASDLEALLDAVIEVQADELPSGVSEEDVAETMRIHGITREEVLKRLGE